ncbi:unnamed protein product [Fusarium graminearum]|uniref:Uncharacterized protein n=1 Tax=Gibberella zeae TaxID=5518 RepID=A0A4E9EM15_GIBZA|nr:unnamed protein product [Fusarium graminearum]
MSLNDAEPPETLFLDMSVHDVLHDPGIPAVEPWATMFIDAVHDQRFGDAIWARYHIFGDVEDGIVGEKFTVLEAIKDDAMRYKKFEPEIYAEAVVFYKDKMNKADTHPEVIEIILQVGEQDLSVNIENMIFLYFLLSFFLFGSSKGDHLATSADDTEPDEPLFLDIPIADIANAAEDLKLVEPWTSRYVAAIHEKRFGDALWARYHIFGEIINGTFEDTNVTVLDRIEEDAMEYKVNEPELFSHALSFYANTSSNDTHTEILDLLANVNLKDVTSHLEERATFGSILHRSVFSFGNCYLRVGPRGPDINYWVAHSVAELIEGHCTRSCCNHQLRTSGWSPKNSSHRKICLSKKSSGCS